jgi:hypothetical protein
LKGDLEFGLSARAGTVDCSGFEIGCRRKKAEDWGVPEDVDACLRPHITRKEPWEPSSSSGLAVANSSEGRTRPSNLEKGDTQPRRASIHFGHFVGPFSHSFKVG